MPMKMEWKRMPASSRRHCRRSFCWVWWGERGLPVGDWGVDWLLWWSGWEAEGRGSRSSREAIESWSEDGSSIGVSGLWEESFAFGAVG